MADVVARLIDLLQLKPLPQEGGYFVESYRSNGSIPAHEFGVGYSGPRSLATAIYFLLTANSFSALHRLVGDEIYHFYAGDPVQLLELFPDGSSRITMLGSDILGGMVPQHIVRGGVWQGSRLISGGQYALLGTTMAPGFDFEDFVKGRAEDLVTQYPERADLIRLLA